MCFAARRRTWLAAWVVLVAAAAPSCVLDRSGTRPETCATDDDCPFGMRCVDGRCGVGLPDAGGDAGSDAGSDAGVDAGPGDGGVDGGTDAGTDAGRPFDPSAIPGLVLWLRADELPLGPLSAWSDEGPEAHVATTVREPPDVVESEGHRVVRFDAAGHLVTDPIRWGGGSTVFLAARMAPGTTQDRLLHSDDRADHFILFRRMPTLLSIEAAGVRAETTFLDDDRLHVFEVLDDGAMVQLFQDGGPATTVAASIPSRTRALGIGGNPVTGLANGELNGDVTELLLFDQPLGEGDRAMIREYLRARWDRLF